MKIVKRLTIIVVILVLLAVVGLVALLWNVDRVAEEAIEYGVPYAMGVTGDAETVSLSLLGGELSVTKLKIGNPEGFKAPFLMNADELDVDVKVMSLWEDTVIVPLIEIKDLTLHIEEKEDKTTNVSVVLENLEEFGAPPGEDAPPPDAAGKSYRVDRVVIRNIVAHVTPAGLAGAAGPIEVVVPEIVMEDVGPDGVAVAELSRRLMPAIIAAVVNKAGSALPDALAGALKDDVAKLAADIGTQATQLIDQVGGEVGQTINRAAEDLTKTIGGELGENVGKAVEDVTKDVGKNLGGAIEGILGGKKKQE